MAENLLFPSQDWAEEYCKRLSLSPDYNKTGKGWKDPILFKLIELGDMKEKTPYDSFILNLKEGKCEGTEMISDPGKTAPYILTATYANWKKIIGGKINPTQAMLTGQMKVKGNIALLLRYASAAIAMVKTAQSVPTRYLDD